MPKPKQPNNRVTFERAATIEHRSEGDTDRLWVSVSSDTPARVWRFHDGDYREVWEILDHATTSIRSEWITDGLVLRDNHGGDQIGIIAEPVIEDGKLGGYAVFGSGARSQEIEKDAISGIRTRLSVEGEFSPKATKQEGEKDGIPVVRVSSWAPLAAAFVAIPADTTVGVNRDAEPDETETPPETSSAAPTITITQKGAQQMPENETTAAEQIKARNAEVTNMLTMARTHGYDPQKTNDAIAKGTSGADFATAVLEDLARRSEDNAITPGGNPAPAADLTQREAESYSLFRGISALITGGNSFELEVSQDIAKAIGTPSSGLYMPGAAIVATVMRTISSTALSSLTSGNTLVQTEQPADYIDMLKAQLIGDRLGIRTLPGLVGDFQMPKKTAGGTGYWVSTDGDVTASGQTVGLVKATPHTVGARTEIARSMLKHASISAEAFVLEDITKTIAQAIDVAIFAGLGSAGQPKGLLHADNINNPTIATPGTCTLTEIVNFIGDIMADNAMFGDGKWAMPPAVWANLNSRFIDAGSGLRFLHSDTRTMEGFGCEVSTNVPAKHLFYGIWSQMILALWGALDINVDQATGSARGSVYLTGLQDLDIMIRNGQSFSYNATAIA